MATIPFILNAIAASGIGPESGAKAYTYVKDTATPLAVYTDTGLTTPASNPVVANSLGYMVFYINSTLNYTIVIKTANDATTLLTVTYTASGSVIAVTQGTVPNYNALTTSIFALESVYQGLDVDLTAYAGLTGTGFVKRTGSGTASTVSETGTGVVVLATGPTLSDPTISSAEPFLNFLETGGATNETRWAITEDAGSLNIQTRNDANAFGENAVRILRSGTDVTQIQLNGPVKIATDSNTDPDVEGPALHIVQTGPTSGTAAGESYYNFIDVVTRSTRTGTGDHPGNPGTATWSSFQISHNAGGTNFSALGTYAGSFGLVHDVASPSSTSDLVGLSGGVVASVSTGSRLYGMCAATTVNSGGVVPTALAFESDFFAFGTGQYSYGVGVNSWTAAEVNALQFTVAFNVGASGAAAAVKWDYAFGFATFGGDGGVGLKSTGSVFFSEGAMTVADVFKFNNVTVSGNFIKTPNIELTGAGALTLASSISFQGTSTFAGIINGAPQINGDWLFAGNPRFTGDLRLGPAYTAGSDGAREIYDSGTRYSDNFDGGFAWRGSGFGALASLSAAGAFVAQGTVKTASYTVATLPAAGSAGRRALVTDANATTFASNVASGGANIVPVYDDGTNWKIG